MRKEVVLVLDKVTSENLLNKKFNIYIFLWSTGTLKERGMLHQLRELNPDEFADDDETYEDGLETYDLISSLPSCLANSSLARRLSTFNKRKTSVGRWRQNKNNNFSFCEKYNFLSL